VCANGKCTYQLEDVDTPCDDGLEATDEDACTPAGSCVGIDFCVGLVCPAKDSCHSVPLCSHGICAESIALADGTSCDDGNPDTVQDTCLNGACAGIDLCKDVVCQPQTQCHNTGTCNPLSGVCSNPLKIDDTPCDDGIDKTTGDKCGAGVCQGVDLCVVQAVQCSAKDQCHVAGVCFQGVCSDPEKTDGTACDDGNLETDDDVCMAGTCAGVDPCAGVTCPADDTCHVEGTCRDGICSAPVLPDDTVCQDDNTRTYFDVCTAGLCTGLLACDATCVAWASRTGLAETRDFGLRRTLPGEGWDTRAFAAGSITAAGANLGVKFLPAQNDANLVVGFSGEEGLLQTDMAYSMWCTHRKSCRQ